MAKFSYPQKEKLWDDLNAAAGLILFGVDETISSPSRKFDGLCGLIDWRLHGQVSKSKYSPTNEFHLCTNNRGAQNFLAYHYQKCEPSKLVKVIKKLCQKNITIAASTFPKDFYSKIEQNLEKEGIRCKKLES